MPERERPKENIPRGTLFFLWHPGSEDTFSGYGLTQVAGRTDKLVGLLMVDRPEQVSIEWLEQVGNTFGGYQLLAMTATGDRGIACQMQVVPESLPYLRQFPSEQSEVIQSALRPLLELPPHPTFTIGWDEPAQAWLSQFADSGELPQGLRDVFEQTGYGCAAVETNMGAVHACHASDLDIASFIGQPVQSQWQLIQMPTGPLIRLELRIMDDPLNPYRFESFLNVADPDQLHILARLAHQEQLHLAFYGDVLTYRYTKSIPHDEQQWQQLDEIMETAVQYWSSLPDHQRDFDQAKAAFMHLFP